MGWHRWCICALLLACGSKQRPHDEALKAQILSNDKRPIVLPARHFDPSKLAEDPSMRRLAFEPTARDMEKRAGQWNMKMKISVDGKASVGSRNEEHSWRKTSDGHHDIRHANADELVEWVIADRKAFVRHGKAEWRAKPYTLEHADMLKRDVVLPLGELMSTFADGMRTSPAEATRESGRQAYRYKVEWDGKASDKKAANLGPGQVVALAKDDVHPASLSAEIVVDKATGLVLSAEVKAGLLLQPYRSTEKGPLVPAAPALLKVKLIWSLAELVAEDAEKLATSAPEGAVIDRGFERPAPEILGFFGGLKKSTIAEDHDEED